MESTLFKITLSKKYSGIFYGPITAVYGFGIIAIELLNKHLFPKIKINKYLKIFLEYLILVVILSLIELTTGYLINLIFKIDMWNYQDKLVPLGKYLCLEYSLIWGLLGLFYIYKLKPFTDKILNNITIKENYLFIILFVIDTFLVVLTKI